MQGRVVAVAASSGHEFSKPVLPRITLLAGLGVQGDAHCGELVKHRSRVRANPNQPNLRQLHLIPAERLASLRAQGFDVAPGALGENVTTEGVDLFALPRGSRLHLGATAVVEVTGLRNPCHQLDDFQKGLMKATLERAPDGALLLRAGIMAVVVEGGELAAGDTLRVELPAEPHRALERV
ncbi:MOSC domain-containing protein [Falsiroseomonas tokyonensis]|uniref:MOSC domain-containing protein n=1 Tax=Falsiroseomonas tokyonensis TaxID=430521 RepID=A0ABV7BW59_9PROT|nr:MOSC domain-containing protein [Falsiroseomonas tokyonensis]MBU8539917.1 MOSC domain-containing protein [Falsiroseomonas tokyonensis]